MAKRNPKITLWVMSSLSIGLHQMASVALGAVIGGTTSTPDAAVAAGIGTFWTYALYIIPIIGVAAIVFGLWNAVATDRGQSSSVVSGLTSIGVGLVIVFIPALIIASFASSGSQAASWIDVGAVKIVSFPIDWNSPMTLLIILGYPVWRVMQMAKRQPEHSLVTGN